MYIHNIHYRNIILYIYIYTQYFIYNIQYLYTIYNTHYRNIILYIYIYNILYTICSIYIQYTLQKYIVYIYSILNTIYSIYIQYTTHTTEI